MFNKWKSSTGAAVSIRQAAETVAVETIPLRLSVSVPPAFFRAKLPDSSKILWLWLEAKDAVSRSDLTQEQIGEFLAMTPRTVRRAVARLVSCGYAALLSRQGCRGRHRLIPLHPWEKNPDPVALDEQRRILREYDIMLRDEEREGRARYEESMARWNQERSAE